MAVSRFPLPAHLHDMSDSGSRPVKKITHFQKRSNPEKRHWALERPKLDNASVVPGGPGRREVKTRICPRLARELGLPGELEGQGGQGGRPGGFDFAHAMEEMRRWSSTGTRANNKHLGAFRARPFLGVNLYWHFLARRKVTSPDSSTAQNTAHAPTHADPSIRIFVRRVFC